ncbi:hypothetical protein JOQ06_000494 [Pogonophryne albipinna]|uniref:SPIN-DOC-like zinc-finger domain-containing protein n=1 Tax=Pogonophryne albipinna TaxID=1090488 RepID=A0AAD6F765_9TELE|nr:hypothetical protein JOQ06_000494 [Pogonophryne albipinna]
MSAHAKKRKVDAESRTFKQIWTTNFFFTEVKGKPVCLVCGEHVTVFKEYNLKRHYETKHAAKYKNLTDSERAQTSTDLLAKLEKQQGCFTKLHADRDAATRTSFVIAHKIGQNIRGITRDFKLTEELAAMRPMKGTTTGSDLFTEVNACMDKLGLEWDRLAASVVQVSAKTQPCG